MNYFYQTKTAIPREAKHGTLRERVSAWREKRLLHVVSACKEDRSKYRQEFSKFHRKIADDVIGMLSVTDEQLQASLQSWVNIYRIIFEFKTTENHDFSGAYRDSYGVCGAELKKILELYQESIK